MDKININTLADIYLIHSPSRFEDELSAYVKAQLDKLGIDYAEFNNMIFSVKPDTPLVCAHLDQVRYCKPATRIAIQDNAIWGNGNLGADDKNGVYICLRLLEKYGDEISFIFSEQEECGGGLDPLLENLKLDSLNYCLVFDRRNGTDLIGTYSEYCEYDLEDAITGLAPHLKPAIGAWSDCDLLSDYIACVNISCGYYGAHTEQEFSLLNEIERTYKTACTLIEGLRGKFAKPEKKWTTTAYGIRNKYWYEDGDSYSYTHPMKYGRQWYVDNADELWKDDSYYEIYEDTECPNCHYDDCVGDSSFYIGDYECYECGAVFDFDGYLHFVATDQYGRYYDDEPEYTEFEEYQKQASR